MWLTLALMLEQNGLETEAMETYRALVQDRRLGDVGRFRVNLGNLHFKRSEYTRAIKVYKMALDKVRLTLLKEIVDLVILWQVPGSEKRLQIGIMKNIAAALMKLGRVRQAVEQYEHIVEQNSIDCQVINYHPNATYGSRI